MGGGGKVAISETAAPSKERIPRAAVATKTPPASEGACFSDWKRFCGVLREIASGDNGRALSGLEAQTRAQAVLAERGYSWPGRASQLPRSTSCLELEAAE
jgi:hypothetical protein